MTTRPGYGIPTWRDRPGAARLPAGVHRGPGTRRRRAQGRLRRGQADQGRVRRPRLPGLRGAHLRGAGRGHRRSARRPASWRRPGIRWLPVAPRTNPLAIASLVCGLAQPFTGGLTMIPAVVLGHVAHDQIRRTGERGGALATVGLVLGWIGVSVVVLVHRARRHDRRQACGPAAPGLTELTAAAGSRGAGAAQRLRSGPCSVDRAATKASCGTSTRPMTFILRLPSFCLSSSLRLRVMSPP